MRVAILAVILSLGSSLGVAQTPTTAQVSVAPADTAALVTANAKILAKPTIISVLQTQLAQATTQEKALALNVQQSNPPDLSLVQLLMALVQQMTSLNQQIIQTQQMTKNLQAQLKTQEAQILVQMKLPANSTFSSDFTTITPGTAPPPAQ